MDDDAASVEADRLIADHLATAAPDDVLRYVMGSNGDGNEVHLRRIADDPTTAPGTIAHLYWLAGGSYYATFADPADVPDFQQETGRWLAEIAERLGSGYYTGSPIRFDPETDAADHRDDGEVRAHHPSVLQAYDGAEVDLEAEGYDDGIPDELAGRILALYDS